MSILAVNCFAINCRYLFLDLQYSVFKVRSGIQIQSSDPDGLKWTFPPQRMFIPEEKMPACPDGLKWTRTTDLTLIRRAL